MASDLLALLDTLDGLRADAATADGCTIESSDAGWCVWAKAYLNDSPADTALVVALRLAYPRLAQALRTALTPTTDGEREAREALFFADRDHAAGFRCVPEPIHRALSTALNLLATERAKAADAARERDELRAALLNESGQGDPPSKGWEWIQTQHQHGVWVRDHMGTMVQRTTSGVWYWTSVLHGFSPDKIRDTAREAMKAADAHTKVTP